MSSDQNWFIMIKFKGVWFSRCDTKIEFSGPSNGDEYSLTYNDSNNEDLSEERITIYISTATHARLGVSKRFSSRDIYIIDDNQIKIGDESFRRQPIFTLNSK